MNFIEIDNFNDLFPQTKPGQRTNNDINAILLGNGFSCYFDENFKYENLWTHALESKILLDDEKRSLRKLGEEFNTNNFEQLMDKLWIAYKVLKCLKKPNEEILENYNFLKKVMINLIYKTIDIDKVRTFLPKICNFLLRFDHVFTTNYDPIIYWALMNANKLDIGDLFLKNKDKEIEFPEFSPYSKAFRKGKNIRDKTLVYYLHGSLFLVTYENESADKNGIQVNIKINRNDDLNLDLMNYSKFMIQDKPMFRNIIITEGNSELKLQEITKNSYLSYVYDELRYYNYLTHHDEDDVDDEDNFLECRKGNFLLLGFGASIRDKHIVKQLSTISNTKFVVSLFDKDNSIIKEKLKEKYNYLENEINNMEHLKGYENKIVFFDVRNKMDDILL